jgi:hypothetical protein
MPTVSRLAADDAETPGSAGHADSADGGSISTGPALPLTLHHDHSEGAAPAEPAAEAAAPPATVAFGPAAGPAAAEPAVVSAGTSAAAASPAPDAAPPVAARPVGVARLIDTTPGSASVGALVGARPLIKRTVQRSAEGGASLRRAPSVATASTSTVGSLAKVSSAGDAASAPVGASAIGMPGGDAAPAGTAGAFEAAPTSFALPPRRLASMPMQDSAARVSRSVQRAAAQQLPATNLPLAPTRGPSQASIEATAMAVAQRAIDARAEEAPPVSVSAPPPSPVQRVVTIDEMSTSTDAGGTSTAGSSSMGQSPAELEQLATKLWGRLRLQLRRELLADRERAGMLTDLH